MARPDYWKTRLCEIDEILKTVKKGKVSVIAKSPGGRDVHLVEYGEKQDFNRTANFSSAAGAGHPKFYADKTGKKPVVFIIGAEHGSEMEGIAGIMNLIQMIETGKDFKGETNEFLANCLNECRLLLVPCANVDGRARFPYDTLVDVLHEDFRHYAQGRWKHNGELCMYPMCKEIHPIKDASSVLGSYFNDEGYNLVHDNFFGKMQPETQALFDIADAEAPDFILHLHGGGNVKNEIAHATHLPMYVKEIIQKLKHMAKAEADKHGLESLLNEITREDDFPPKTFNIMSAMYFATGAVSVLYESNQGLDFRNFRPLETEWEGKFTHEEILQHHYILFEQTIKLAKDMLA
ncbi:MAG: hypothetical protein FWE42_02680 [Defluviitaleaceae bacterium]|nr:hypothetical protein [Defluviitaleaceae bacterium]